MLEFNYVALDPSGARKRGAILANDSTAAVKALA